MYARFSGKSRNYTTGVKNIHQMNFFFFFFELINLTILRKQSFKNLLYIPMPKEEGLIILLLSLGRFNTGQVAYNKLIYVFIEPLN